MSAERGLLGLPPSRSIVGCPLHGVLIRTLMVHASPAGRRLEVVGARELRFFPGVARGSVYRGFSYESEDGSTAAPLDFLDAWTGHGADQEEDGQHQQAEAVGEGEDGGDRDGGGGGGGGGWQRCRDYVNGGPMFLAADGGPAASHPGVRVLARYPELGGAAAALACRVGAGRAVLCGSHPELHPSWLDACSGEAGAGAEAEAGPGGSPASPAASNAAACVDTVAGRAAAAAAAAAPLSSAEHVRAVRAALGADQAGRWRLWCSLLCAAGLGEYVVYH